MRTVFLPMSPPPGLVPTLYRELLRSCRRTRAVMRPTHVVLVAECVQKFADRSPALAAAVKAHGPLPLPSVVQHAFRLECEDAQSSSSMIDHAFGALRMMHSVEAWVTSSALALLSLFLAGRGARAACARLSRCDRAPSQITSCTTASRGSAIARRPLRRA